jgi:hypothetical protein
LRLSSQPNASFPSPHRPRADPNRADYGVIDDGWEVGRIYEDPHASQPWFWSLVVFGAHLAGIKAAGRADSFEDAKAQFRANHERWLLWAKLEVAC